MPRTRRRRSPSIPKPGTRERAHLVDQLLRLPSITCEQSALVAQTHEATIRRACAAGELAAVKLRGRKLWRIRPAALLEWLGAAEARARVA